MRYSWRELVATVLVAAIAVPYVGYLVRGSMPFIEDPRGMAATGLVLGAAAALVARDAFRGSGFGQATTIAGTASAGAGFAALVWAENGTVSDILLAVFMAGIGLTWALAMVVDTGLLAAGHRKEIAHR
jgi:hypothetical protein